MTLNLTFKKIAFFELDYHNISNISDISKSNSNTLVLHKCNAKQCKAKQSKADR